MKQGRIAALFIIIFFLISYKPVPKRIYGIKTVVIDAGHGGHDVGCIGSSSKEKSIALSVSLKLGELIEEKFPDVRVIYTRKKDEFIELHERAGIANRAKADLFICIHCNSGAPAAYGAETFVMGLHKTAENLAVARRENSSALLEKDYKQKYDGFDPNSAEANIIFTLFQNAFMNQSIAFASKIQNEFEENAGRNNRGVKQAGFLVLYKTAMPSVLIETGFLTNKNEEKYLLSDKGQMAVASSIFKAFKEYKIDMEGEEMPEAGTQPESKKDSEAVPDLQKPKAKNVENNKENDSIEVRKDSNIPEKNKKPVDKNNNSSTEKLITASEENIDSTPAAEKISLKTENKPEAKKEMKTVKDSLANLSLSSEAKVFYTVQIGAIPKGGAQSSEKFSGIENVKKMVGEDGVIRFTIGNFQNINTAIKVQTEMRTKGFKDAFVTAYHNNKRITLKEASELLKKN